MGSASCGRWLVVWLLLAIVAGCSGSSGGTSAELDSPATADPLPPADDPAEDPAEGDEGGDPGEPPMVQFSASDDTVDAGGSTTLTWNSDGAISCQASGGWTGSRDVQGSSAVGPLNASTTFTLTCDGDGGSSVAMLSVAVVGSVNLAWQPPAENEDGSPLTDLSGYRIYYGSFSRDYNDSIVVNDADATEWDVELTSGEYYIAMTAFDVQGNESAYSNEIVRSID